MKFSEIDKESWEDLRPYLDTCLIPVTGLTGREQPYEVVARLERLRDMMDLVEIPYKGRIVTYPSIQYGNSEMEFINEVCHNVKLSGFAYVIVVSSDVVIDPQLVDKADLILTRQALEGGSDVDIQQNVLEKIQMLWQQTSNS